MLLHFYIRDAAFVRMWYSACYTAESSPVADRRLVDVLEMLSVPRKSEDPIVYTCAASPHQAKSLF